MAASGDDDGRWPMADAVSWALWNARARCLWHGECAARCLRAGDSRAWVTSACPRRTGSPGRAEAGILVCGLVRSNGSRATGDMDGLGRIRRDAHSGRGAAAAGGWLAATGPATRAEDWSVRGAHARSIAGRGAAVALLVWPPRRAYGPAGSCAPRAARRVARSAAATGNRAGPRAPRSTGRTAGAYFSAGGPSCSRRDRGARLGSAAVLAVRVGSDAARTSGPRGSRRCVRGPQVRDSSGTAQEHGREARLSCMRPATRGSRLPSVHRPTAGALERQAERDGPHCTRQHGHGHGQAARRGAGRG